MTNNNSDIFKFIYRVVKQIPVGKVATYGYIAEILYNELGDKGKRITPRIIGFALHANGDKHVPCHRVVDRNGRLAPNFGFNGAKEQRIRLQKEGIGFIDEMHVNLRKYLWHK